MTAKRLRFDRYVLDLGRGVRLSTLLDEAGIDPAARWIVAEGADACAMSRSIPLAKAMEGNLN